MTMVLMTMLTYILDAGGHDRNGDRVCMKRILTFLVMALVAVIAVTSAYYYLTLQPSPFAKLGEMQVSKGEVGMLYLGYSTFVLKTSQHTIVVDPAGKISTEAAKTLGRISAILVTHEHSDHFDPGAATELFRATDAVVVVNMGAYDSLKGLIQKAGKLVKLEPREKATIDGIVIEAFIANHSGSSPVMYAISVENMTLFHGSDSGFSPSLEQLAGKVDLAILPVGGASQTASPLQALKMAATLHPKKVIPVHGPSDQVSELKRLLANSSIIIVEVQENNPQKVSVP